MAINVELKNEEKTVEKIDFPVLMTSKNANQVVLFTSEKKGTCLLQGSSYTPSGTYSDTWVSCADDSIWRKFTGEITLKNK